MVASVLPTPRVSTPTRLADASLVNSAYIACRPIKVTLFEICALPHFAKYAIKLSVEIPPHLKRIAFQLGMLLFYIGAPASHIYACVLFFNGLNLFVSD